MDRIIAHIHLIMYQVNMWAAHGKTDGQPLGSQRRSRMSVKAHLDHVAIPAQHPKELASYYLTLLGLDQTLEGTLPNLGDFVFLGATDAGQPQTFALLTPAVARHIACQ